jgi:tetratricopeptide (TPR) repeat protein
LTNKGLILIELQRYEEAIDVFDKILSNASNNVDGLYNKGVALEKIGMIEEANKYTVLHMF